MARFHMDWQIVESRMPGTPKEIAAGWKMLTALVKEDLAQGALKDWGAFPGDLRGYAVAEGTDLDVMKVTIRYAPYVAFTVRPVSTIETVVGFLDAASR